MSARTLESVAGPALLLGLLTAVMLTARPFTPIDETRYLGVAWEMWLRDEYLVLFKNGEPYSHKPPLLFWLYNLGWAVFGVSEWWPRMISPLFSMGGLLLTLSIARRLWPAEPAAGRNALWILASTLLWMVYSTIAMFDVMLAFFVLVGVRGLLIAANESLLRGFSWLGLAIGVGVLAKGPVILLNLLPAALLAPWWRDGMPAARLRWKRWYGGILLAVLAGAAIALAWAIPAAIRGGEEYRDAIFWGQTANRMVDSFAHRRPFWWYLPLLPVFLFPWLVWPGLWSRLLAFRQTGPDHGLRFCLAWAVPVFVSFSLISGKQPHYLVPLLPAFALFAGRMLARSSPRGIAFPALLTGLLGGAMVYFALAGVPEKLANWDKLPAWPGLVLLLAAAGLGWYGRDQRWRLQALAVLGAAMLALVQAYLATSLAPAYDVHPIARQIRQLQDRGVPVANAGRYHAQFQFAGRLEQPLDQLQHGEILPWLDRHPNGVVVMYGRGENVPARNDMLFRQAYRGGVAMLLNAEQARSYLASDGGKSVSSTTTQSAGGEP
jgi:4-amino-4-deoxy-L-arabinose transferase-like glycosyltransferase